MALTLVLATLTVSCSTPAAQVPTPTPSSSPAIPTPTVQLGPGGLTLDEEIGAVMMVGFQGPVTDATLTDWRQRQFGGLLVVNLNHNASSAQSMTAFVGALRGTSRHRLIAATDQEGGFVCLAISTVPCAAMPVGQAETTRMAAALKT